MQSILQIKYRVIDDVSLTPSCVFFTNNVGGCLDIWQLKLPYAYTSKGLNLRLGPSHKITYQLTTTLGLSIFF